MMAVVFLKDYDGSEIPVEYDGSDVPLEYDAAARGRNGSIGTAFSQLQDWQ
jgi:hypothetical protein